MKKDILLFDVESTSLHGTGFAVGAVVYRPTVIFKDVAPSDALLKYGTVVSTDSSYRTVNTPASEHVATFFLLNNVHPLCVEDANPDLTVIFEEKYMPEIKYIEIDRFELLSKEGAENASDWVKENVLPNLADMPTCETDKELRDAFFDFYMKHKENAQVWSDVNYPVETNFLSQIYTDAPKEREWLMPYPLYDVSTLIDVQIDRIVECNMQGLRKHNPLDDSIASVNVLIKSL